MKIRHICISLPPRLRGEAEVFARLAAGEIAASLATRADTGRSLHLEIRSAGEAAVPLATRIGTQLGRGSSKSGGRG